MVNLEEEIDEIEQELRKNKRKAQDISPSQTESDSTIQERRSKQKQTVILDVEPRVASKRQKGDTRLEFDKDVI